MKTFFVITIAFTVLSCCHSATTMLRNGDIIEIESLDPSNGRSGYEIEKVIQAFGGNKQPVTFEIVTNGEAPAPYQGQMQYYNNYYNENRQRPMYRPQRPMYNWNQPSPNTPQQYHPQYNPYNRPHHHDNHQRPFDYGQQQPNQQNGNNQLHLTKQPTDPNYPEFEIYTVDVTNTGTNQNPYNNNQYPNVGNDQYGNRDNPDVNNNSRDKPKESNSDENKSKENIKDKVDGYIDKFPVILLKENEIRR